MGSFLFRSIERASRAEKKKLGGVITLLRKSRRTYINGVAFFLKPALET